MKNIILVFISLFFIDSVKAQNVGIGTSSPSAKLEVNGTFKITDGTQGPGKVLTSDATGMASWQPASSSPPGGSSNTYEGVGVCCQIWMTENLDVVTYRNGDTIPMVSDTAIWNSLTTGAYCYYDNDSTTYAATYGKLYNWHAINDSRGLAPEGWHIATDFEWTTLGSCLGGNEFAGGPMKEHGTDHWNDPNIGGSNLTGFHGLPGGYRGPMGAFSDNGNFGLWWSSTDDADGNSWFRYLDYNNEDLFRTTFNQRYGLSVRCVKN